MHSIMTPTTMEEENVEHRLLATFEKRDSFFKCLDTLLSCDLFDASPLNDDENAAFRHLTLIVCIPYIAFFWPTNGSWLVCRISGAVISS